MTSLAFLFLGTIVGFVLGIGIHRSSARLAIFVAAIGIVPFAVTNTGLDLRQAPIGIAVGLLLAGLPTPLAVVARSFAKLQPRPGEFDDEEAGEAKVKIAILLTACGIAIYLALTVL